MQARFTFAASPLRRAATPLFCLAGRGDLHSTTCRCHLTTRLPILLLPSYSTPPMPTAAQRVSGVMLQDLCLGDTGSAALKQRGISLRRGTCLIISLPALAAPALPGHRDYR